MKEILKFLKKQEKMILYLDCELPQNRLHKIRENEKYLFTNSLEEAIKYVSLYLFDMVILDTNFSETEQTKVFDLIKKIRTQSNKIKIIAFSKKDDFQTVLFSYQAGIDIFIPKDNINPNYFQTVIKLLMKNYSRIIISKNRLLQKNYELMNFYAKNINTDILIQGENGTGKGIIAEAIHALGEYKGKFVVQNCAGIPDTLFESEMFGYEPNSFTGADKKGKIGVIENADNGVLFLDEIGDLPLLQQAKLLRAIQRKVILRVGSTKEKKVNIRYVYATNKNLFNEVKNEAFREDFYYRLKGAEINIPSLRNTPQDIEIMVAVFVNRFLQEQANKIEILELTLNQESLEELQKYNFPGNMRELQKIVYQSMINMLLANSNELILKIEKLKKQANKTETLPPVETFWQIIELLESGHLRYGGIVDRMKNQILQHLRTKYNDDRQHISQILKFKDKQSLANEIYRLNKNSNVNG